MTKLRLIAAALVSCVAVSACAPAQQDGAIADFVVNDVHIIPMDEEEILENHSIAIKDGKILEIFDQPTAPIQAKKSIDGAGRYLMPGLADMHVHVRWDPERMFELFLANGVTTAFNMGLEDGGFDHLEYRRAIAAGEMLGPRYFVSGPQFHDDDVPDVSAVGPLLDEHIAKGYDLMKIHGDLPADAYDALIECARKRGVRLAGHTQRKRPLEASLGLNSIEHMEEFIYVAVDDHFAGIDDRESFLATYRAYVANLRDPKNRAEIVKAIAASDVFIDATLLVYANIAVWADDDRLVALAADPSMKYLPDEVKAYWLEASTNPYQEPDFPLTPAEVESNLEVMNLLMDELHAAGVPFRSGTDGFGTIAPGLSLHDELALMTKAGLSSYEALEASTINVARYLGTNDNEGAIREGFRADFILLDKNPLRAIENSKSVSGVFSQGQWLASNELEAMR